MKISQNFVAFSEYMNFKSNIRPCDSFMQKKIGVKAFEMLHLIFYTINFQSS